MAPKSKKDTVWKLIRDEDYDGLIPKVFVNHNKRPDIHIRPQDFRPVFEPKILFVKNVDFCCVIYV